MPERDVVRLLVAGTGPIRFGLRHDDVEGVYEWADLPSRRRVVNLPRLFDLPDTPEEADRYAGILGIRDAYLRLGLDVKTRWIPADRVSTVPAILQTAAARWGWAALAAHEDFLVVVVDAAKLAKLGAERVSPLVAHGAAQQ